MLQPRGPVHGPDELLHDFMLAAAESTPDSPAVVTYADGGVRPLTFRQLRERVDRYATILSGAGVRIGDRVVLIADTSASSIAMFLACSTLGAAFVPVSPSTAPGRLRAVVAAVAPVAIVAEGLDEPGDVGSAPVRGRFTGDEFVVTGRTRARSRRTKVACTDTAYMIFTSGTTGRPKGVVMSHRGVVSFYRGMLAHGLVGPGDRVATTSPLQFDFSLLDIGLALGSGAAVVPVPRDLLCWPTRFVRVLRDTGATQVNGVPSIWRQTLRHLPERLAELTGLRGVLFCGEEFPMTELRVLQRALPGARIVNCYGSTESMACSFADVPSPLPAGQDRLSIGTGHPGAELFLVDEHGEVIGEPGRPGELHLRGPALFTGYWDDERATAEALVPDPVEPRSGQRVLRTGDLAYRGPDGEFHFTGRCDSQVQIRGNRVELGEVERRILDHPGVANAAVTVSDDGLTGFVVLTGRADEWDDAALTRFCLETLPDYMVPSTVRVVAELPVNQNGKVDRAALAGV